MHGALYQEQGLLTSEGKEIKNKAEILALLEAIWLHQKVAIIHCRGHQTTDDPIARGNTFADQIAREAAQKPVGPLQILPILPPRSLPDIPSYTEEEKEFGRKLKGNLNTAENQEFELEEAVQENIGK